LWVLISRKKQGGKGSKARNGGEERTGERAKLGREGEILVCEKTSRQVDYVCELFILWWLLMNLLMGFSGLIWSSIQPLRTKRLLRPIRPCRNILLHKKHHGLQGLNLYPK
jgi:hypothetical protein